MARLDVPHHPDRVFKDDWWDGYTTPSGYRALATDDDPLEAFAVLVDDCKDASGALFIRRMITLDAPFERCEPFLTGGQLGLVAFYAAPTR